MKASHLNRFGRIAVLLIGGWVLAPVAAAQAPSDDETVPEELELTMTLMPADAELPDAVTKTIELPTAASESGVAASEQGLATANGARQNRQEGFDAAADARERGQEFGEAMAEQARENREDAGRGDPPVTPPNGPPDDLPVPPDPPQN